MKAPNGRLSADGSARPADKGGGIRVQLPPNLFYSLPDCVVFRTICFKQTIKYLSPLKVYFGPQILKPGYRPGSAKIVSAIRIFCFEGHSVSRCSKTSKTSFINHH